MKNRLLRILFLISIIFNMAFIGNYIYRKYFLYSKLLHHKFSELPHHKLEELREIRKKIWQKRQRYLQERKEFMLMLQSPDFNKAELEKKLKATIKNEMEMEKKIGENLIKLRSKMTPQEAKEFFRNYIRRLHGINGRAYKINRKNRRIRP